MKTAYKLLYMRDRKKGLQAHIKDTKEDVIRVLYLDPKTYEPLCDDYCPEGLTEFLQQKKDDFNKRPLRFAQ